MNRRLGFLYIIPLGLALITFLITQNALYTALALLLGFAIMQLARNRLLPPFVDRAARAYRQGNLEDARLYADQAITARPEGWEGYYIRSLVNFSQANHQQAEADARRATELGPAVASSQAMLGQILYWQGRLDEALPAFVQAHQHDKRDPMNHFWLGATYYQLEQFEESIPHLELVRRLKIPNPQLELLSTYYLGMALHRLGEEEAAQQQFGRLKEYDAALERLRADLEKAPPTPTTPRLLQEVAAIEMRMGKNPH